MRYSAIPASLTLLACALLASAPASARDTDCEAHYAVMIDEQLATLTEGLDLYRDIRTSGRDPDEAESALLEETFALLRDRNRPVSTEDVAILNRSLELFTEENWDREDDRNCDNDAPGQLSIFCALQQASIDVRGHYHHRRTALQEVRFVIADRSEGRDYAHRMRDYNNDPQTSYAEARSAIAEALTIVEERLAQQESCEF